VNQVQRRSRVDAQPRQPRSAVPSEVLACTLTTSRWRLSVSTWPRSLGSAGAAWLLRYSRDCGSFVESCVSLLRGSPRQSSGGWPSSVPSSPRRLSWLAQAWMSMPSALKCSPDSSPRCSAICTVALNSSVTTSCSMSRSRFLLKTECFHTVSSMARPTKQRNSMSYRICSTSCRSLPTLQSTCSSMARMSFFGAKLGRPPLTWGSRIAENLASGCPLSGPSGTAA
jgi:hypothetical protein